MLIACSGIRQFAAPNLCCSRGFVIGRVQYADHLIGFQKLKRSKLARWWPRLAYPISQPSARIHACKSETLHYIYLVKHRYMNLV